MRRVSGVMVVLLIVRIAVAFDLQNFYTPFGDEGFAVTTSDVLGHLQFWAGSNSNYSQNPLELTFSASGKPDMTKKVVDYYFVNQFGVAVGFFDFLQLGIGASYNNSNGYKVPLAIARDYRFKTSIPALLIYDEENNDLEPNTSFWAGYIGDIRAQLKGQILKDKPKSVGIAIFTEFTYPPDPSYIDFYMTFGSLTAAGFLVLQKTFDISVMNLTFVGNGGFRYVAPVKYEGMIVGFNEDNQKPETEDVVIDYSKSEIPGVFEWRAGTIFMPAGLKQLSVNLETVGRHFDPDPNEDYGKAIDTSNSIEALLGIGYKFGFGLKLAAAGGTSIIKGTGGPDYRALFEISFIYPPEKEEKTKKEKKPKAEAPVEPKVTETLELEEKIPPTEKPPQEARPVEIAPKEIIRLDSGIVLYENRLYVPKNILFKENSTTEILKESLPILQDLLKLLEGYPTLAIRLVGYADLNETTDHQALAIGRAEMVKKFFVSRGISPERIEIVGKGSQNPIDLSGDPDKRRLNRRVEVEMISL